MRKIAITLAAAAAAVGLAAPASATFYGQPVYGYGQGYGYGYNPGYGYGYQNNYRYARNLQYRVDHLQRELARLAQYRMISRAEYYNLRNDSRHIELQLRQSARFGLNAREIYALERRLARLEYRIARDVRDGRRWGYSW